MASIGAAIAAAAAALAAAGFDEPRRRARRLVATALGLSTTEVFAHPERPITDAEHDRVAAMLQRVLAREPLSRIAGIREFWGLPFRLSPDTLDPRPETETLVEAALARLPDRTQPYRFLDLGTGTGCLLLALLSEYPAASGIGVDIAPGAVLTARANARVLGLAGRAHFLVGNWGGALGRPRFDAVVANPPYIPTDGLVELPVEVRGFDPGRALDGGADGLAAYRAIAADLPRLMRSGGVFVVEIGAGKGAAVAAIVAAGGLAVENLLPDLAGIPRCIVARRP